MSDIDPNYRREQALFRRTKAAVQSVSTAFPAQTPNDDQHYPFIFNFTKGLEHNEHGLLYNPAAYELFVNGTRSADPAVFSLVPLFDPKLPPPDPLLGPREYESPTGGHAYVLEGPDAFALAMPPAPAAGSAELAAELAEVYQMALHRELPVAAFMDTEHVNAMKATGKLNAAEMQQLDAAHQRVIGDSQRLSQFRWFAGAEKDDQPDPILDRRRFGVLPTNKNLYRGIAKGDDKGPFLSQFMVIGTDNGGRAGGTIRYGNQRIEQKVRVATPGCDYMTDWQSWLNVQNAFNARKALELTADDEFVKDAYGNVVYRPITRLRDLATYVHDDQLYQAYLNAALILLGSNYATDPGIPYHKATKNPVGMKGYNREPFAVFGPPHLLTLVTEVASRALRAVRAQKFSVHRRLRPEALAALMHTAYSGYNPSGNGEFDDTEPVQAAARSAIAEKIAIYAFPTGSPLEPVFDDLLTDVRQHNEAMNQGGGQVNPRNSWLLPMAFPEGSPMHPAYGAGHATVAGACVSMLKAFFAMEKADDSQSVMLVEPGANAYVPSPGNDANSTDIQLVGVPMPNGLSLEGELNKLAWNIANARNIAGVHYFTDYIESLILGENITLAILREQMACYDPREKVSMILPLFVPRTLPEVLGVDPTVTFTKVKINADGSITKA